MASDQNLQRILIIAPSWVGDMVMAHSLFQLLKTRSPDCQLDVLAPSWTFPLLSFMPEVSQAIEMPFGHGELQLRGRYRLAKALHQNKYDQAIVLPNSFKSALVPWLAAVPHRCGWLGEVRYFLLNDRRHLDKNRYPLMVERYLALGLPKNESLPDPFPLPVFHVTADRQKQTLAKHKLLWEGQPLLVIAAGGEYGPSKRWLPEYFAEVACAKIREGWQVWLFGSVKDQAVTQKIMELTGNRCENLAGRITLAEGIYLLSLVNGLVTNDSGLMHIAAALNKPLVALYGSTSPTFTPPLSSQAVILKLSLDCQPCFERNCPLLHHRCMRDLRPAQVLAVMSGWHPCVSS